MKLHYYGLSDPGNVRSNNEDCLFAGKIKEDYLFIIADGMGGHRAGEVASQNAVKIFVKQLEQEIELNTTDHNQLILEKLEQMVINTNDYLIEEGSKSKKKKGMGTTFSALYIKNDCGYIVHIGDSRIYQFIESKNSQSKNSEEKNSFELHQLTDDHSLVGKLLKFKVITEEEARQHPRRNVLYQSLGLKKKISIHCVGEIPIQRGQKFLLCSDGLYSVVPNNIIGEALSQESISGIVQQLVQQAKTNGGPDNISVIVISTGDIFKNGPTDTVEIIEKSPSKKRKSKIWLFIILVLLLTLLTIVIFFIFREQEDAIKKTVEIKEKKVHHILNPQNNS